MKTLHEQITWAQEKRVALGHFNISNLEGLWGIVNAARKLDLPVIIGVSEGERDFIGIPQVRALIISMQQSTGMPIYLNADHTYSFDRVKEVAEAGFDAVIFDGSELSLEENISQTKQVVEYVKSVHPQMLVEGELGYIGKSSKLLDEIPAEASITAETMTSSVEAVRFVHETGVDLLAPAVGNIHGMLKNAPNPNLDIPRIEALRIATGIPMVLHGGSGISDADFIAAAKNGMSIIHINTEIRKAWKEEVETYIAQNPDEVAPYKVLASARDAVAAVVENRLSVFNQH